MSALQKGFWQKFICVLLWNGAITLILYVLLELTHFQKNLLWMAPASWIVVAFLAIFEILPGSRKPCKCPFCAEKIQPLAIFCKYCQKHIRKKEEDKTCLWSPAHKILLTIWMGACGIFLVLCWPSVFSIRIVFGKGEEILYAPPVTHMQAIQTGKALQKKSFFDESNAKTVLLAKDKEGFILSFVVKEGVWDAPQAIVFFQNLANYVSTYALQNRIYKVVLCDNDLKNHKSFFLKQKKTIQPWQKQPQIQQNHKKEKPKKTTQQQWQEQLQQMKKAFVHAQEMHDKATSLKQKITIWKDFTGNYLKDNPYSLEDDNMRYKVDSYLWKLAEKKAKAEKLALQKSQPKTLLKPTKKPINQNPLLPKPKKFSAQKFHPPDTKALMKRFGTQSPQAAQQILLALQLSQQQKNQKALLALEKAIKHDPNSSMAYFQKAIILNAEGKTQAAIVAYQNCIACEKYPYSNVTINAYLNIALTYAKIDKLDLSNHWFTKTLMADPHNLNFMKWKAYRNLAINLFEQQEYYGAALAAIFAFNANQRRVQTNFLKGLWNKSQGQNIARILHSTKKIKIPQESHKTNLQPLAINTSFLGNVSQILVSNQANYIVALIYGAHYYYLIKTKNKITMNKITINTPITGGYLAKQRLYVITSKPTQIRELAIESGYPLRIYDLQNHQITSLVVYPSRNVAYFLLKGIVHCLELSSGKIFVTSIFGTEITGHPDEKHIYSWIYVAGGLRSLLAKSSKIALPSLSQSKKTCFLKSLVVHRGLLLSHVREESFIGKIANISLDGQWMALHPNINSSKKGILVVNTHNLNHLQSFFAPNIFIRGAAIESNTGQIALIFKDELHISHLQKSQKNNIWKEKREKLSGIIAWSSNGQYLLAGLQQGGLAIWKNTLAKQKQMLPDGKKQFQKNPGATVKFSSYQNIDERYKAISWIATNNKWGPQHPLVLDFAKALDGAIVANYNAAFHIGWGLSKSGKPYLLTWKKNTFFVNQWSILQAQETGWKKNSFQTKTWKPKSK